MSKKANLSPFLRTRGPYAVSKAGFYGEYGGRYAPEVLMPALIELEREFYLAVKDKKFLCELGDTLTNFVGRPSPLLFLENLTRVTGGAKLWLKNEGQNLTGAHKINHCVGQILLAKRMGKRRIIAETGAGQHGLATATVCARYGMECVIYMGARDVARQRPNVVWMERLGATVIPVKEGGARLKDAVNAALKDWITNVRTSHYLLGSALGPHPFPELNRFFQSIVGVELKSQFLDRTGKIPDYLIACVGGGSNSIGFFDAFLDYKKVILIGVEAGGMGLSSGKHAARLKRGRVGVVEGYRSLWLQDEFGQVADTHSISAGLDYAGVGPIHAYLQKLGRVDYVTATDKEVLSAIKLLARCEGILSAIESGHAVAHAIKLAKRLPRSKNIVINLSGRGEKDLFILAATEKNEEFMKFLVNYVDGYIGNTKTRRKR